MKSLFNKFRNRILQLPFVKHIPDWMDKFFTAIMIILFGGSLTTLVIMTLAVGLIELIKAIFVASKFLAITRIVLALSLIGLPLIIFDIFSSLFLFLLPFYATITMLKFMFKGVDFDDLF